MTTANRKPTLRSQAHLQGAQGQRRKTHPCKRACLHPRCTSSIPLLGFLFLTFGLTSTYGQTTNSITTPTVPSIQIPQVYKFRPVENNQFTPTPNQFKNISQFDNTLIYNSQNQQQPKSQIEQYERDLQAVNARDLKLAETQKELKQEKFYRDYVAHLEETKIYRNSYTQLLNSFNPDSFSIIKATYLVENAFYNNTLPFDRFANAINARASLVKQILKREQIDPTNNTAINYGIQKLFSKPNNYYNAKTKQSTTVQPLKYDFKDFKGEKDLSQVFVTKLLMTGKGQCHSMPLLYLCLAEALGAKANLSLAPEHSFIQIFDNNNKRLSFECTNGNLVSESWLLQSGFINSTALKNKTYLDTLSQRKLFAQCLADLAIGYQKRFGNDEFLKQMQLKIEMIDSTNLTAKILNANIATVTAINQIKEAGSPKLQDLPNYPEANQAYLHMQESYNQLDNTGFQNIPKEAYQVWRKSIAKEQQSQKTKELQRRMQQEIEMLKKVKTVIINNTKN
jgi:hypothetical protein